MWFSGPEEVEVWAVEEEDLFGAHCVDLVGFWLVFRKEKD